jgi:3-phenylpropionate/cinnamic acid dioxygenase small subunit
VPEQLDAVERVAAELAIRNLLARIAQSADAGTPEEYLGLFTEDAVWEMPANPALGLDASARRGVGEIGAGVTERRAAGIQGPGSHTRHMVATISVDVTSPDTAVAHSYWTFWTDTAIAPAVTSLGAYRDELRRTPAGWKLARRTVEMG